MFFARILTVLQQGLDHQAVLAIDRVAAANQPFDLGPIEPLDRAPPRSRPAAKTPQRSGCSASEVTR